MGPREWWRFRSSGLSGVWLSRYAYVSTSMGPIDRCHHVVVRSRGVRVEIRSIPGSNDSRLELRLTRDGRALTGTWTEYTAVDGHYRGARYHGAIQLVVDPTGRSARGRWVGYDRSGEVDSGPWELTLLTTGSGPGVVREHARPATPRSSGDASRKGPSPGER
ncbi:hypothetical protein [Pseudonocardia sp. NPDC049635]|uniref:hypothetical protein n=1 Tax=Pseudonocardia sp. NPDC049635 TaxID=3155506 RepID=UPI00340282F9